MNCRVIDFFLPKTRNYWCNGTGRDTYIYTNSGGFSTKSTKPLLNMVRSSSLAKVGKCNISPKQLHYHSNGTGRDQYIVTDEGGFSHRYLPHRSFFSSTLRSYERLPSLPTNQTNRDYFQESQCKVSLLEKFKQRKLYQEQQFFTEKMCTPKVNYQKAVLNNGELVKHIIDRKQFGSIIGKQQQQQEPEKKKLQIKPILTTSN